MQSHTILPSTLCNKIKIQQNTSSFSTIFALNHTQNTTHYSIIHILLHEFSIPPFQLPKVSQPLGVPPIFPLILFLYKPYKPHIDPLKIRPLS